jgi:hypothetical protein
MKVPKRAPLDAVHHLLICSIVRKFSGRIYCKSYILEFGLKRIYFSNVVLTRKGLSRYRKGVGWEECSLPSSLVREQSKLRA